MAEGLGPLRHVIAMMPDARVIAFSAGPLTWQARNLQAADPAEPSCYQ